MTPERESEIERICQEALERRPAERAAFVAERCASDFLETPALAVAAHGLGGAGYALTAGQRIGAYTIVSPINVGGIGRGLPRARHNAWPRRRHQGSSDDLHERP